MKLFKKYFVLVAENPIIAALWLILLPVFLLALILFLLFKNVPDFQQFLLNDLKTWGSYILLFVTALNITVPFFFMTFFYRIKKRIVLIKPDGLQEAR